MPKDDKRMPKNTVVPQVTKNHSKHIEPVLHCGICKEKRIKRY